MLHRVYADEAAMRTTSSMRALAFGADVVGCGVSRLNHRANGGIPGGITWNTPASRWQHPATGASRRSPNPDRVEEMLREGGRNVQDIEPAQELPTRSWPRSQPP